VALLAFLFSLLPCSVYGEKSGSGERPTVVFEDNIFYQNNLAGARIRGSAPTHLEADTIYANGRAGVNVGGTSASEDKYLRIAIDDTDLSNNVTAGINVEEAVHVELGESRIHDNALAGVRMVTSDKSVGRVLQAHIRDNRIYQNGRSGVRVIPETDELRTEEKLDLLLPPAVDLLLRNNEIHDNVQAGLRVENNTRLIAEENLVRDNGMGVISYESAIPPRLDVYRNNISFNTGPGIHVINGITNRIGVRNNWVFNNERSGIVCGIWGHADKFLLDIDIINNTVVSNGSSGTGAGIRNNSKGKTLIMNNIVAYNYVTGIRTIKCKNDLMNLLFANGDVANCCEDPDDAPYWVERNQFAGCPERGKGDLIANPLFINPDSYNFRLRQESPAIDAGNPSALYDDISLPSRKGTDRNDMGATGGPYAAD
jgi:hypothetical protein